MYSTVLVAIDGSGHAKKAAQHAAGIAAKFGAKLIVMTANEGRLSGPLQEFAETEDLSVSEVCDRVNESASTIAQEEGVANIDNIVATGDPAEAILKTADLHKADLIVVGTRGLGPLQGMLLGSVARKVVQLSQRPCLVVHE